LNGAKLAEMERRAGFASGLLNDQWRSASSLEVPDRGFARKTVEQT
jgi:hypothetical protein